jgi:preprotein translocase subunit SecF
MKLDFMKYKLLYFLISLFLLIPAIVSLTFWGLKPAVDFTGGSVLEVRTSSSLKQNQEAVEDLFQNQNIEFGSLQKSGEDSFILKFSQVSQEEKNQLLAGLSAEFDEVDEVRFETVGPTIGRELIKKTITAVLMAASFILLYVAWRFKDKKYGISAILAMFHDTLILLGVFSFLGHFFGVEVDTLFVTAVLTILSFSVHDTVVVYDRIRESVRKNPRVEYFKLVNKAVAETLTRSVNNSMTIIFMLTSLWLLGGETIKWFVFALLIGTIAGTYSSTFTAAPLLILWDEIGEKFKSRKKK